MPAVLLEVLVVAAGDGLVEFFGLKKSASVFFFSGEPAGLAAGEALAVDLGFFACFWTGEGDAAALAAGEAAGDSVAAVSDFL